MTDNAEICLNCPLTDGCAYDRDNLTIAQQDALCPAEFRHNDRYNSHAPMTQWRLGKLKRIQTLIDEDGPIPLVDMAKEIDVSRHTLWDWVKKKNYLQAETQEIPYRHWLRRPIKMILGINKGVINEQ